MPHQHFFLLNIEINKTVNFFFFRQFVVSYFYCRAIPVWPGHFSHRHLKKMKNLKIKKKKKIFLLHKLRPFPRLLWAELSCAGGFSTIQAPVLAETHAQEGAGQGKRKRRRWRRRRRCKSSLLLVTFFGNGLLEGCWSPQVIVDFSLGPHGCLFSGLPTRWTVFSIAQRPWASVALVYFRRCYWKHKTKCLEGTIKK